MQPCIKKRQPSASELAQGLSAETGVSVTAHTMHEVNLMHLFFLILKT